MLPVSSCLSRRSPDWTREVPNTVIQAHTFLANRRMSTEDRIWARGAWWGGSPFPGSTLVLPTCHGGFRPLCCHVSKPTLGSQESSLSCSCCPCLRHQDKLYFITESQVPGKVSKLLFKKKTSRLVMSNSLQTRRLHVAHQAPLFMGFSRQEFWSGQPFPSPGDIPDLRIEPGSPALQADSLPFEPLGKP